MKAHNYHLGHSFEHIILYTFNVAAIYFSVPSLYMEYYHTPWYESATACIFDVTNTQNFTLICFKSGICEKSSSWKFTAGWTEVIA